MKNLLLIIIIALSFNANAQWVQQTNLSEPMLLFIDLYAFDANHLCAVGQFEKAFITTDGGSSWVNYGPTGSTDWFEKVDFTDSITGYACTLNGSIFKTTNAGLSWNQVGTGFNPLYSIAFINSTTGYAVGIGNLLKTTNAGVNWSYVSTVSSQPMNQIFFVNASIGFIVGNGGYIYKTTNGGLSWSPQTSGTTSYLNSVFFANPNTGWIVGPNGLILNTINGGTNWNVQNSGTTKELIGFYAIDANIAYAVGASGTILYTSDGGLNWSPQISNTTSNLLEIKFIGNNIGYTVGNNGRILKTTNAGMGIDENGIKNEINIYPNPFNTQTTISFSSEQKNTTIRITDVLGKEIKTLNFSGSQLVIEKAEMKAGIYFVQTIDTQKHFFNKKIIIQ